MRRHLLIAAIAASMASQVQANEGFVLEEVVVTAQKRAQTLNDVGIAVSAFSGDQMRELGIGGALDMAKHTPGLYLTEAGASGIPVYTIRGVGFDDISPNSNGTVGLYVDEVAVAYPVMTRGAQFDVERIEVLKGPQGDLYGRNNTGGAINFISNKPTEVFEAGISVDYGRYDYKKLGGFVSGAVADGLNGRVAFEAQRQSEGWQQNELNGDKLGEVDTFAGRVLLDWAAGDSVNVLFNLHGSRDQSDNQVGQAFFAQPSFYDPALCGEDAWGCAAGGKPRVVNDQDDNNAAIWDQGLTPSRDVETWGGSITVNWDLDHFSLTSITSVERFERSESNDWDGLADVRSLNEMDTEISGWSQELRLTSSGATDLTWIADVYLAGDEVEDRLLFGFADASNAAGVTSAETRYEQNTDIHALFAHAEYELTPELRLTLGARYTHEQREIDICTYDVDGSLSGLYNFFGFTESDGTEFEPGDCGTFSSVDLNTGAVDNPVISDEITTEKVTGKIGLDYLPNEDWLIYASVGTGFKSGGFNGQPSNGIDTYRPYQEEELLAYELGFKATLLDSTMQLNGAAFLYDYRDKQVGDATPDPVFGFLTKLKNVPRSEVKGLELELQWRPFMGLDVKLATTWLDTRVEEFDQGFDFNTFTNGLDLSGSELPNAAQWSYNALVSYEWPVADGLVMRATADYMYTDDYYSYLSNNDGTDLVEDYQVFNARLSLGSDAGDWELSLWGKNLGDEFYYVSNTAGNDVFTRYTGQGQTYGVSLNYNFQ